MDEVVFEIVLGFAQKSRFRVELMPDKTSRVASFPLTDLSCPVSQSLAWKMPSDWTEAAAEPSG